MTDTGPAPRVGAIIGCECDPPVMLDARRVRDQPGVGWESRALSAHRPHPVATVGINAARSAGILAVRVSDAGDPEVRGRLRAFEAEMARSVEARNDELQDRVAMEL